MDDFIMQKLKPKTWKRSDSANWYTLKDIEGDNVLLPENFAEILLSKKDGSERFIPLIREVAENPFEIWLQELKNNVTGQVKLVKIYIGFYKCENIEKLVLVLKCDTMEGNWVASDLFEVTLEQADLFRAGILIYPKSEDEGKTTPKFRKGDRVIHPEFGLGMVVMDDVDGIVTVDFDQAGTKRLALQYACLRFATPAEEDAAKPGGKAYEKWLETFVFDDEKVKHSLGSHWEPFYDDTTSVIKQIPDILPKSLEQVAFSDARPAPRACPPEWQKAVYWTWPLRVHGLISVVRLSPVKPNELVSVFPFCAEGIQHRIVIDKVHVWESGVEAQIEAVLGDASITFFDTLYARNRDWYESNASYQFILTGIAYACKKAEDKIIEITNPDVVEAIRKTLTKDEEESIEGNRIPIHTKRIAVFLPIQGWDRDDYQFRGTIKSVKEIEILDQTGWKVRTTVIRNLSDDSEIDLDIIVTRKAWGDGPPPQTGDDIEGILWLQGYLWYPEKYMTDKVKR
ncbi:MAG: hypothetical protein HZB79_04610 [Deltaproteobacteria bacterium]|nr:hypothetical protein [Deltaproteobacteria bacterium]